MNDHQAAELGLQARMVLDNPAFVEALRRLHELSHQAFLKTDLRDAEGLKLARQFAAVTADFEQIMRRMVEGGKLAQINLDKHRDEGAARRVLRAVSR